MANDPTRRLRRAAKRLERQRRLASGSRNPVQPRRGRGWPQPPPPDRFDDPEGGAGVREPRRPVPSQPAGAMELEPAGLDQLNLTATPLR
jgi:hypothetical protein